MRSRVLALAVAGLVLAGCGSSPPKPRTASVAQLQAAVAAAGGSLDSVQVSGADAEARITAPVSPGVTASGWLAWPTTRPLSVDVLWAHGCCGVPDDAKQTTAALEQQTHTLVASMDYRDADTYAPDVAAEDLYAVSHLLHQALPGISRTVAAGHSEGGAVTGLLVAAHPGLVDTWVDLSGAVDLGQVRTQLQETAARPDGGGDPAEVAHLQQLVDAAVGNPPDDARVRALSPAADPSRLTGVKRVVIVHASGDLIVPVASSQDLAAALHAEGVPTQLRIVDPAAGQPAQSVAWHSAQAVLQLGEDAVVAAVGGHALPGAAVEHSTASLP